MIMITTVIIYTNVAIISVNPINIFFIGAFISISIISILSTYHYFLIWDYGHNLFKCRCAAFLLIHYLPEFMQCHFKRSYNKIYQYINKIQTFAR